MASDIRKAGVDDIPGIVTAARMVWHAHYPGIISPAQIDYMLGRMYAPEVIASEIEGGEVTYFLMERDGALVAFAACGPSVSQGEFKLHKLYVLPSHQRLGFGRRLIQAVIRHARERSGERLILCVNKGNASALAAYARCGFRLRESICVDIGGGFQMDDHILELELLPDRTGIGF